MKLAITEVISATRWRNEKEKENRHFVIVSRDRIDNLPYSTSDWKATRRKWWGEGNAWNFNSHKSLPHRRKTANFCIISRSPTVSMKNGHLCRKNKFLLVKHTHTSASTLFPSTKQNSAACRVVAKYYSLHNRHSYRINQTVINCRLFSLWRQNNKWTNLCRNNVGVIPLLYLSAICH